MDTWNLLFKEISLDWIIGLPLLFKNSQKYNSILIVVCYVTKYILFILIKDNTTTTKFAKVFFEYVECRFGTL